MSMPAPAPRRRAGFTLVELMVTLAMLGIMFGMVFLNMGALVPGTRIKSGARELAARLEQARNFAVSRGMPVLFEYDIEASRYRYYLPYVLNDANEIQSADGITELFDWQGLPDTIRFRDVLIGEGDPFLQGRVTVRFEPRGIATAHIVHLVREEESEPVYSVTVSPLLAFVDVAAGDKQPEAVDDDVF